MNSMAYIQLAANLKTYEKCKNFFYLKLINFKKAAYSITASGLVKSILSGK